MGFSALILVLLAALAALGFRYLVMATPLGKLPYKPFNCATCLCGWGAILGAALFVLLGYYTGAPWWHSVLLIAAFALAALGLSRLIVALVRGTERNGNGGVLPPLPPVQEAPRVEESTEEVDVYLELGGEERGGKGEGEPR